MATFSERLKELRKAKGVTQKNVADAIGVAERGIRRYEAGDVTPGFDVITALAEYFKVSTDYMLGVVTNPDSFEQELVNIFHGLDTNERNALIKFAEFLRSSQADNRALLKKLKAFQTDVSPEAVVG